MRNQSISVQRAYLILGALTVALYLLLAILGTIAVLWVRGIADRGEQAYRSDCAQKEGLRQTVVNTVEYLQDHPGGIAGVDAATVARSVTLQAQTVYRMQANLHCGTPDLGPLPPLPGG